MKNAIINARIELELKSEVEAIFKQLGMNTTQAITMFLNKLDCIELFHFKLNFQT